MPEDVIVDGREAERLLKDPTLLKAFGQLEAVYIAQWKIAKTVADREQFHARVIAIGDVLGQLGSMKSNKAMAESSAKLFGQPKR